MRNAARILTLALGAATLAACNKQPAQNQAGQDISIEDNAGQPAGELPANAEIETLPADESSATPSNQLQTGYDNPDVNDLNSSNSE